MIFITGGAGFIGSNFAHEWRAHSTEKFCIIDKLSYAGNRDNIIELEREGACVFVHADIQDRAKMDALFAEHQPRAVIHFAAESHVDRSISSPEAFMQSNILGTFSLLEAAREFWQNADDFVRRNFRFIHVSTDEVFGSLGLDDAAFSETTPYAPNSPYSASKAASDHLARAWFHTYGLPTIITNCSNNYGPRHFPEKLIPLVILNALAGKDLPIYGKGDNIRDWLFVLDHCAAIRAVLERGNIGETYNIGGQCEKTNLEVVQTICDMLDQRRPRADGKSYREQIRFVADRPGHDQRYAIDSRKIQEELGWQAQENFVSGVQKTIDWYLSNEAWVKNIQSGAYRDWLKLQYGE